MSISQTSSQSVNQSVFPTGNRNETDSRESRISNRFGNSTNMIPTHTSTCIVCNEKYAYRKGKQYCSSRCKQKAYIANKDKTSLTTSIETNFDFSLTEFKELKERYGWEIPVHLYCFLRRGLRKDADIAIVNEYMNSFYIEDDFLRKVESTKAFQSFQEEFFAGKYLVG